MVFEATCLDYSVLKRFRYKIKNVATTIQALLERNFSSLNWYIYQKKAPTFSLGQKNILYYSRNIFNYTRNALAPSYASGYNSILFV